MNITIQQDHVKEEFDYNPVFTEEGTRIMLGLVIIILFIGLLYLISKRIK
jgi:DNA-directed RNA polymerase alpha subunit